MHWREHPPAERTLAFQNPKTGEWFWKSNPGPQSAVMWSNAFEILLGGQRGGGKTAALMAWMVKGNPDLPEDDPCFATLINHPKYRGLILRRNAVDLKDFISEATPFYAQFGGKPVGVPTEFHFGKNGAIISCNHLGDDDAFEKYRGWSLARIGIEELTQIASEDRYLKILSCCRTTEPRLRPKWSDGVGQCLSTTNPDGIGAFWVKKRFVTVEGANGKLIPWGKKIRDPVTKLTKTFIPAKLSDNPFLDGNSYRGLLMMQADADPRRMRAWLHGDWDAMLGSYFDFRPVEQFGDDPSKKHVIPAGSVPLMPWWPRYIGVDWGFAHETACYWGCQNKSDERFHIYREFVANGMTSQEIGAEIARQSIPDLYEQNDMSMPMFLSHECFNKIDGDKTRAHHIAEGIERILGRGSVEVAKTGADLQKIQEYQNEFDGSAKIYIRPGTRLRNDGWNHIRGLLRLNPIVLEGKADPDYIQKLLAEPDGFNKVEKYVRAFDQKPEVLPKMLVWDCCPKLIMQFPEAIPDPKDTEDILEDGKEHSNDRLDALRHICIGVRDSNSWMPKKYYVSDRMSAAPAHAREDPTIHAQVLRKVSNDYDRAHQGGSGMRLKRLSSRRVN